MPQKKDRTSRRNLPYQPEAALMATQETGTVPAVTNQTAGTYGSTMIGAMPGADFNPELTPSPMVLDGSELNPLYDPNVEFNDFAQRDLHQNDVDSMQRLLQSRLGQIEMLKQFSLNNDNEEIRSELHALQAQYERMASEIRQMILVQGDQPSQSLDFGGRMQSLMHIWQSMTNEGAEAVDVILNTESEVLGDEELSVAALHNAECRDLAQRQLGEERQIYQRLRELAQNARS